MDIPEVVAEDEKIIRSIFHPFSVDLKKGKLKPNAFKSPPNKDEVSVLRLRYTSANFCKVHSRNIANQNKEYIGLAVLDAIQIYNVNAYFAYTPTNELPMHVDLIIGCIAKHGEPLPPEYNYKLKELARIARFYKDPFPDTGNWDGPILN